MQKLYRSNTDKKIAGICGGLAEMYDMDPVIVRLVTIALTLITGVFPLFVVYLLAWWLVPRRESLSEGATSV
jgi:phage shock protein PspC (stress-responsive transcriptional regulator)